MTTTRYESSGSFRIPAGVYTMGLTVRGAGGSSSWGDGGKGAEIRGTIAVTPGDFVALNAGWSWIAGATDIDGAIGNPPIGGGGGESAVALNGSPIIVAGGGGQPGYAGGKIPGGDAGYPNGEDGANNGGYPGGGGGTQSADGTDNGGTYWTGGGGKYPVGSNGYHIGGNGYSNSNGTVSSGAGGGSSWYAGSLNVIFAGTSQDVQSGYIELSYTDPPNIPTIVAPTAGSTVTSQDPVLFQWRHEAPAGQFQADVQIRPKNGSATDYPVSGDTQFLSETLASGYWEWRVRTYTTGLVNLPDAVGPWSAWVPFTVGVAPPPPVITAPADSSTILDATGTIAWTAADQESWQARVQYGGVTTWDSGAIVGAATSTVATYSMNNQTAVVQVRVKHNNLWSDWASVTVTVTWVGPNPPEPFANGDCDSGAIRVGWTQDLSGPAVDHYSIEVIEDGVRFGLPAWQNLPADTRQWTFWMPRSGVDVTFYVFAYSATGAYSVGTVDAPVVDIDAYYTAQITAVAGAPAGILLGVGQETLSGFSQYGGRTFVTVYDAIGSDSTSHAVAGLGVTWSTGKISLVAQIPSSPWQISMGAPGGTADNFSVAGSNTVGRQVVLGSVNDGMTGGTTRLLGSSAHTFAFAPGDGMLSNPILTAESYEGVVKSVITIAWQSELTDPQRTDVMSLMLAWADARDAGRLPIVPREK